MPWGWHHIRNWLAFPRIFIWLSTQMDFPFRFFSWIFPSPVFAYRCEQEIHPYYISTGWIIKIFHFSTILVFMTALSLRVYFHIVWKLLKMSHLNFWILAFSTIFCPIKTDMSGNTVWPQASGFQKLAKMDDFWHFLLTFVHSKCKLSSLRSQCWMRLKKLSWWDSNLRLS